MEQAQLVRIAEYRPLPGGKVERVYAAAPVEPPGDEAARDQGDDGTWTRVLVTMVDLQDRTEPPGTTR
jgi:hypothetical protein